MQRMSFVGRGRELALLDRLWASPRAELLILYGRRRVGKTRLLTHWLGAAQGRGLYWVAEPSSAFDQLRSFSQALYNFANPGMPAPEIFSYASWSQAFQQLVQLAQRGRVALLLDEFTYLLEADPGVAGALQNAWDHLLSQANLLLVISGSHMGMMERHLLSYQAPLYGRATALLRLAPLPYADTRRFFPGYGPEERVTVYAMLGGIPAYWERFDPALSVVDNLRRQFLESSSLLLDEPRLLLQDFVSEAHNYVAILSAIAHGSRTPKEIAAFTGLMDRHVPAYLARLVEAGLVERRLPVTASPEARSGRHAITDPFLRFYFRFLARRQSQLALGVQDQALAEIQGYMVDFIGMHTWEELCQEWLLRTSASAADSSAGEPRLPFLPDQVGSAWTRRAQVDVVGINSSERTLYLGECKWGGQPSSRPALRDLVERTAEIVPAQGRWRVYYLGFARAGWTPEAQQYAQGLRASGLQGENWSAVGMHLLDLEQVDRDLAPEVPQG